MNFCLNLFKILDKRRHQKREQETKWRKLLKQEDQKNKIKEQKKIQSVKISKMIKKFNNKKILINCNKQNFKIIIRLRIKFQIFLSNFSKFKIMKLIKLPNNKYTMIKKIKTLKISKM